jgi:hypothetical protein
VDERDVHLVLRLSVEPIAGRIMDPRRRDEPARDGHPTQYWPRLDDCGERLAGVFEASPGRWGARRLPVVLGAA